MLSRRELTILYNTAVNRDVILTGRPENHRRARILIAAEDKNRNPNDDDDDDDVNPVPRFITLRYIFYELL